MTEGNYSRFCGKNNNGIKKIMFILYFEEITRTLHSLVNFSGRGRSDP